MQGADAKTQDSPQEHWDLLFQEALEAAQFHVNRLTWRGTEGGVLPHGYDPNSIAAETILELIKNKPWEGDKPPPDFPKELRRRVWRHVDRLHHLKENFVTLNEPDLAPVFADDGERFSIIDFIRAPDPTPLDILIQKEKDAEFALLQAKVKTHLGRRHRLKLLFDLLCDGVSKPSDLARRLKVRLATVANIKARLRRQLTRFFPSQNLRTKNLWHQKNAKAFD